MTLVALTFLIIGGLGVLIAAAAMVGGSFFEFADGMVSIEGIASFVGAFGFGGAVAYQVAGDTIGVAGAAGAGVLAAVPAAFLAARLMARLKDMPTDATPAASDLVGCTGIVVTPVPAGGVGEVRIRIGGQPMKLYARSAKPITLGAPVEVIEALSETTVVVTERLTSP